MSKLIKHVEEALRKAELEESKITKEILEMPGMSGRKTRHFYNNLCSMKDARYLEIGTWMGSSLCSAMCKNHMICTAVDNWSEFGGPKETFLENFNKFKEGNQATFIEDNCWNLDVKQLCKHKYNIFMYDGDHQGESHFKALGHFLGCLDDEFIFLVDDWNWNAVNILTYLSIFDNEMPIKILWKKDIFTPSNDNRNDWHNGLGVFILKKGKNAKCKHVLANIILNIINDDRLSQATD